MNAEEETVRQREVLAAMSRPDFFPDAPEAAERRETHISAVFLTRNYVYKVKKAVDLGFLDFGALEARRRFCEEEVRLNRRLAPDVYEGVFPVTRGKDGPEWNGGGEPMEYAVLMRRLPADRTLPEMRKRGACGPDELDRLAEVLAGFFRSVPAADRLGGVETVRENCEENFRQLDELKAVLPPGTADAEDVRRAAKAFLARFAGRFEARLAEGHVREGHGDLRGEHVYLLPDGVRIIDCIEFNERMRCNDLASDLAFLLMDLDYRGDREAGEIFLGRFLERHPDDGLLGLLDFYRFYRACVRWKVAGFQWADADPEKRSALERRMKRCAELAREYARAMTTPVLYVAMGVIAAGKSTVADALGAALGEPVLRSDEIRRELFGPAEGKAETREFGAGMYGEAAIGRVYDTLESRAEERLRAGRTVVLDATYREPDRRRALRRMAAELRATILFVECRCPMSAIRERLARREGSESELSDARLTHLEAFLETYAPPSEIPDAEQYEADTSRSPRVLAAEAFFSAGAAVRSAFGKSN
jgi:aminoglycoside phosphotransferase family enzyme/predicted kinase